MAKVQKGRYTAAPDDDLVVFLIGMRYEDLNRFARAGEEPHLPAWKRFNKAVRASGDVGIWHETYKIHAGEQEAIYGNMPIVGLAAATRHAPVGSTAQTSAQRIGAAVDEPAVAPYENP